MAGKGPRPKDPSRIARRSDAKAREAGMTVFHAEPVKQPELPVPPMSLEDCGWPEATRVWWENWGNEPMTVDFRPTDWDFMLDTALIHAREWGMGEMKLMPELRLRVAKMGATAEDRARLRITYAQADDADDRRAAKRQSGQSARARRGPLKAV